MRAQAEREATPSARTLVVSSGNREESREVRLEKYSGPDEQGLEFRIQSCLSWQLGEAEGF